MKVDKPYYSKLYTPVRKVEASVSMHKDSDGDATTGGRFGGFEALRQKAKMYEAARAEENYAPASKLSRETLFELNAANEERLFNVQQYKSRRIDIFHDNSARRGKAENIEV